MSDELTRWHTVETSPDILLIQDGDRLVGSIGLIGSRWCVEIMWSGPGGDIKGDYSNYPQALAFVEGVEKTVIAFTGVVTLDVLGEKS